MTSWIIFIHLFQYMSPVSPVFHAEVTVSIGLKIISEWEHPLNPPNVGWCGLFTIIISPGYHLSCFDFRIQQKTRLSFYSFNKSFITCLVLICRTQKKIVGSSSLIEWENNWRWCSAFHLLEVLSGFVGESFLLSPIAQASIGFMR